MPLLLTEQDLGRALDMGTLIPAMREALARFSRGDVVQPVRPTLKVDPAGGYYATMPAYLRDERGGALGMKSVTFFPRNAGGPHPTHLATILLLDPANGSLLAVLDGRLVTEMRTAAVTAVSVDLLARKQARRVAILGSGVQARSHLRALALVRGLEAVRVWSRTAGHAERFVRDMAGTVACPLAPAATVREAMRGADVVVAVTSAREPITDPAWLEPGMHLCAVGSSTPDMRELDGATVARCRTFVDSRASAEAEAGDLIMARAEGHIGAGHVIAELGEVAAGAPGRRGDDEVTLFKSLGLAVEDVVTARLAWERARDLGLGTTIGL
ncbi:MAG TPA: ornithine cyclodeaminase family protein [Gemmatimonadales bacterium]|nr:ornithine cyclodeaminase family protein [Gemmatimonadales bacterium]